MVINLSEETITTAYNSLRSSRHTLKHQLEKANASPNKKEIIEHQLEEVEDALFVFEELLDNL
jgi:predicted DNA-binding protein